MKWKKKFNTFNLLAGLTVLMFSACNRKPQLQIISTTTLPYPSASGMEFFQNKLYVFGDNAPDMLVLTTDFQPLKKVSFWPGTDSILSKEIKPDIESVALLQRNGSPHLVGVGSMSGANRWVVYEYDIKKDSIKKNLFFNRCSRLAGLKKSTLRVAHMWIRALYFAIGLT